MLLCVLVLAVGCAKPVAPPPPPPPPPVVAKPSYQPLTSGQALELARQMHASTQGLGSWRDLEPGLKASLAYVSGKPAGGVAVTRPGLTVTWGAMRQTLEDLIAALPYLDDDPALLAQVFLWYPLQQNTLVTGYYEPFLQASLEPDPEYPYAIYGHPEDLLEVDLGEFHPRWKGQTLRYRLVKNGIKPYYARGDIDFKGALKGKGAELAWVKDRVDLYFLQIQGSGRLILPDGSIKHVLYADKNGRELDMLGRTLIRRGYLTRDNASMPAIRSFVQQHQQLAKELLSTDKSYVFFRLADNGPYGSMGKLLTPMSSVAIDRSQVPLGAMLAMSVDLPAPKSGGPSRLSGLMMAQDTGGAIRGNHVDLFCGSGAYAEFVSGRMKNPGQLHLLLSKRALGYLPAAQPEDEDAPDGRGQYGQQEIGDGAQ
ncbi:MAG: MltA domain-containing protein [Humidesulfovibrio sp.]|nr:MltA domain-containing protein [Humidesulfovibrio sp.]